LNSAAASKLTEMWSVQWPIFITHSMLSSLSSALSLHPHNSNFKHCSNFGNPPVVALFRYVARFSLLFSQTVLEMCYGPSIYQ